MIPWQVGCVVPVLQFNLWIELQSTDLDLAQSQVVGFEGKHAEICRGQSNMRKKGRKLLFSNWISEYMITYPEYNGGMRSYCMLKSAHWCIMAHQLCLQTERTVLDWRLMSCPLVLPRTSSKHFVDDLAICFRGRSLDTIERHLQQAVNAIQEWARNGFRFAAHKCKVINFTAPWSQAQRPPIVRIGNTLLPVEESTKFLGLWWDSHLSFKKHISVLKTQYKEALNLIRVVTHLKWGGDRDTLLMLYCAIVHSKFDYGCIVYGTA